MGTYTLTDAQVAALAAFGITPEPTTAPAAVVAPAAPVVASPFTANVATAAGSPVTVAMRLYPHDRGAQRSYIATTLTPGLTCDVDTTATMADGSQVPSALHGFTTRKTPGEACPGRIRG